MRSVFLISVAATLLLPSVALAQQPAPDAPAGEPAVPAADPAATDPVTAPVTAVPAASTTTTEPIMSAGTTPTAVTGKYSGLGAPPPGHWRMMVSDLSILRINPVGIETRARVGLQKRLYPSTKPISQNNFMFLGAYPKLNPASAHLALGGELQPVSIFNLKANVEVQKYFGSFGFLQSFATPHVNYSDQTLKDLEDVPGFEPQSATAFHASFHPMLQLKLGKVAVRSLFQVDYWDFKLRAGDTVAYEATYDTLLPDKGFTLATDTDVLFVGKPGLAIGLRHTWVKPLYKQKHFADPDLSEMENAEELDKFGSNNGHQRLGLFAAYTLHDRGPSRFNKPTVIVIASWYLDHEYRTGAPSTMAPDQRPDDFTSRAFPYLLVGFAFESDFANPPR
jgi:hypothetical protein